MKEFLPYLLPPIVGGVIGLITNKIAIWMLFHPRKKWSIFGLSLPFTPGLIPRDREILIGEFSQLIEAKLLSGADVVDLFSSEGLREGIVDAIDETVEEKLSLPLIPENLKYNIKLFISQKILAFLDDFVEKHSGQLGDKIQVKEKIRQKMTTFSIDELEGLVYEVSGKHLRMITLLGGLLGFFLGFTQVVLHWLI